MCQSWTFKDKFFIKIIILGAIQKLRGQDFGHFWLPTYINLNVDKKKHFLPPTHLILST